MTLLLKCNVIIVEYPSTASWNMVQLTNMSNLATSIINKDSKTAPHCICTDINFTIEDKVKLYIVNDKEYAKILTEKIFQQLTDRKKELGLPANTVISLKKDVETNCSKFKFTRCKH